MTGLKMVRLGDICSVMDVDHKMPKSQESGIPFISVKDLSDNGELDFADCKFISEEDYNKQKKKCSVRKNDVLFSRIGTIGLSKIVEDDTKFGISYSLCIIRSSDKILPEYLENVVSSPIILNQAKVGTRSIAVPD